jgi:hypothetical protein
MSTGPHKTNADSALDSCVSTIEFRIAGAMLAGAMLAGLNDPGVTHERGHNAVRTDEGVREAMLTKVCVRCRTDLGDMSAYLGIRLVRIPKVSWSSAPDGCSG